MVGVWGGVVGGWGGGGGVVSFAQGLVFFRFPGRVSSTVVLLYCI